MQKRSINVTGLVSCLVIASIILLLGKFGWFNPGIQLVQIVASPLQHSVYASSTAIVSTQQNPQIKSLQQQILNLQMQLSQEKNLESDNKALRDQFQTSAINSQTLLPAHVIGAPGLLPGITKPDTLIIDQGKDEGVKQGQEVVYKNVLLGQITNVSTHEAQVLLISAANVAFPVTTQNTNAVGVSRGQGNGELILDNVLLSETLKVGDTVVTKGNKDLQGNGFLPGLIIGDIVAINKQASSVFQSADVQSPVDVSTLPMVFVQISNE